MNGRNEFPDTILVTSELKVCHSERSEESHEGKRQAVDKAILRRDEIIDDLISLRMTLFGKEFPVSFSGHDLLIGVVRMRAQVPIYAQSQKGVGLWSHDLVFRQFCSWRQSSRHVRSARRALWTRIIRLCVRPMR